MIDLSTKSMAQLGSEPIFKYTPGVTNQLLVSLGSLQLGTESRIINLPLLIKE